MQLDEYITETLVQIVKGVNDAAQEVSSLGGTVNPHATFIDVGFDVHPEKPPKQTIKFDIAIQVKESTDVDASAKAKLSVFSIGCGIKNLDESNIAHRVTFEVPLDLPCQAFSNVE